MRLEAKLAYMNSVTGETHGNLPDAEDAYWAYIAANGVPAGAPAAGSVTNASVSATAAIALTKLADVAAGTDGLAAGTLQATLQSLATRIAALEAV